MNHEPYVAKDSVSRKVEVNITLLERFGRIIIGLLGIVGGIVLLTGSPTPFIGFLEILLIAAGVDLVVTGATGHCPLYSKLGYTPESLKGNNHEARKHERSATRTPDTHKSCH